MYNQELEISEVFIKNSRDKNIKSLNILIVDDEDACLTSCSMMLLSLGHKVMLADGGVIALEIINSNFGSIDLIFLDLMMPDLHGIKVLQEIKSQPLTNKIPVIIQSGISDKYEIRKAYDNGALDFVAKPYSKINLQEAIDKIF